MAARRRQRWRWAACRARPRYALPRASGRRAGTSAPPLSPCARGPAAGRRAPRAPARWRGTASPPRRAIASAGATPGPLQLVVDLDDATVFGRELLQQLRLFRFELEKAALHVAHDHRVV